MAVAESGAKKTERFSTEENIQASNLFNFYQAKKLRSTINETAAQALEATASAMTDEKGHAAVEKQIADWKAKVANFERYTKNPDDSLGQNSGTRQGGRRISGIIESQGGAFRICQRHLANRDRARLPILAWIAGLLGLIGAILMAFGYLAPAVLTIMG